MIIGTDAITPKAAKATSTYPACIVKIHETNEDQNVVYLNVYCPSTMSGSPKDAVFAVNNVVEAPKKPHNGADNYDFKVGGVIIISYADGNVNSPQFVRYVNVSDKIIEENSDAIRTGKVIVDTLFSSFDAVPDDINNEILKRGKSLLPYVQYCSKGSIGNNDIISIYNKDKEHYLYMAKCGRYGTEFIGKTDFSKWSHNEDEVGEPILNYLYDNTKMQLTFLSFCKSIFNDTHYEFKRLELINILENVYNMEGIHEIMNMYSPGDIIKGESQNVYLWQMLCGYQYDWENGGYSISPEIYKSGKPKLTNGDSPDSVSYPYRYTDYFYTYALRVKDTIDSDGTIHSDMNTDSVYQLSETDNSEIFNTNVTAQFWRIFSRDFSNELNLYYAAILHNNLTLLSSLWGVSSGNIVCCVCAVVMAAYPLLERVIIKGSSKIIPANEYADDNKLKKFLKDIESLANTYETDAKVTLKYHTDLYSEGFADLYFWYLGIYSKRGKLSDYYDIVKRNIKLGIENLVNDFDTLDASYKEEITNSSSNDNNNSIGNTSTNNTSNNENIGGSNAPYPGNGDTSFIWPVPASSSISCEFSGRNYSAGEHLGVDIATGGQYLEVVAVASGVVESSTNYNKNGGPFSNGMDTYGNSLLILHDDGRKTRYAHLHKMYVGVGTRVVQGQVIGITGNTGNSFGIHLHFEVYADGNGKNGTLAGYGHQNPLLYISYN